MAIKAYGWGSLASWLDRNDPFTKRFGDLGPGKWSSVMPATTYAATCCTHDSYINAGIASPKEHCK